MRILKHKKYLFLPGFLILLISCSKESNQIFEKTSDKNFENIIQDSEFIITENNFRITNRLHIGEAIQDRGTSDFPKNEVILFCNLTLAEEMLKIEPRYINFCPYKITVTEFKGQTIIGTRLLPTQNGNIQLDEIAEKINVILRSMVEYAASEDIFILEDS